jgi:hypothetical protein
MSMSDAPNTRAVSIITDHPFEPRTGAVVRVPDGAYETLDELPDSVRRLPPNTYLCAQCRLAEAAHLDTTVTREEKR